MKGLIFQDPIWCLLLIPLFLGMFFVWSLSNGVMEDYAKEVYEYFDENFIFNKLEFKRERNYDLIVEGECSSLSGKINELNRYISKIYDYGGDTTLQVLGIENKPQIMDSYLDKALDSLKSMSMDPDFKKIIDNVLSSREDFVFSRRHAYPKGTTIENTSKEFEISLTEALEVFNPLLFLGILSYSNHQVYKIEGWNKLSDRWTKI